MEADYHFHKNLFLWKHCCVGIADYNNYIYQNNFAVKKLAFFFTLFFSCFLHAQNDFCSIRISLLTCTPGQELYSTFGHSAIRVTDPRNNTDIIFNYGTFDFDDPGFYSKFTRGKLLYFVSVDSLQNFLAEYEYFQRGVIEQVLHLSCTEKEKMVAALFENAKEENKYYRYDFTYDNCTTRLRDMLEKATGDSLQAKNILPAQGTTFRNLIHEYLHKGNQYWSQFGIDILLGSPLDKKISNREAMFLPDYLLKGFDSAQLHNRPLVIQTNTLIPAQPIKEDKSFFTPFVVFSILFLVITILSFLLQHKASIFLKSFDVFFFLLLGLLGLLLLFMWFGTSHLMTKNNYNLVWALPTHLTAALFLFSKKKWVLHYFRFLFFYTIALLAAWFLLPQQMNIALLPLMSIILVRSYFISKKLTVE